MLEILFQSIPCEFEIDITYPSSFCWMKCIFRRTFILISPLWSKKLNCSRFIAMTFIELRRSILKERREDTNHYRYMHPYSYSSTYTIRIWNAPLRRVRWKKRGTLLLFTILSWRREDFISTGLVWMKNERSSLHISDRELLIKVV